MNELVDRRPIVNVTKGLEAWEAADPDRVANAAGRGLTQMLAEWPDVDLPTIRITKSGHWGGQDNHLHLTGRRGPLVGADGPCPSCHQLPGRPPTEYCRHPEWHPIQP